MRLYPVCISFYVCWSGNRIVGWMVGWSVTLCFFGVLGGFCITAPAQTWISPSMTVPAHPHATLVAVYSALFSSISFASFVGIPQLMFQTCAFPFIYNVPSTVLQALVRTPPVGTAVGVFLRPAFARRWQTAWTGISRVGAISRKNSISLTYGDSLNEGCISMTGRWTWWRTPQMKILEISAPNLSENMTSFVTWFTMNDRWKDTKLKRCTW